MTPEQEIRARAIAAVAVHHQNYGTLEYLVAEAERLTEWIRNGELPQEPARPETPAQEEDID